MIAAVILCIWQLSDIHRKRNCGSPRSTRLITMHERTAIRKSQLEAIIENPGKTRAGRGGGGGGGGGGDKLLVAGSQTDYTGV